MNELRGKDAIKEKEVERLGVGKSNQHRGIMKRREKEVEGMGENRTQKNMKKKI